VDNLLAKLISADTPKINPIIANGLAVEHMKHVEEYVDTIFRSAAKGFPEGLTYHGCRRCTPQEEYAMVTRKKGTRQTFDVARSDLYMMQYFFKYKGQDLDPRYLYLPFVTDAGCIVISGSRFNISPILLDRVISVGMSNIFVRLLRDKLTFERMSQHYMVDGKRETVQVAWASIYHKNQKMKKLKQTVKANCTLMHYLFCKYGFTDTFLKFGRCRPVVGYEEINRNTYPEEEWVICTSTQVKPKGVGRYFYEPTNIRVAVRKEDMTPIVKNMIGGFFYVVDHFPSRILAEYVESKRLWMILLGHIIFSGNIPEGKLHDDIEDHITSLDEYIDGIVVDKLKEIGIEIEDVYQLFAVVIEKFNDWILMASDRVSSMYDKELSILYSVLYEISSAIFNLYFKLKAASKKELTIKEINATMNVTIRTGLIYSITKNHREISTVSSPGDNKAFKITALLVPQSNSNRANSRKGPSVINNPAQRLHVSVAEVGSYLNLPKSEPSGRSRINPCVQIDSKGVVLRNPKLAPLLDGVQEMIKR
jgi:hypothetical protein